MKKIVVPLGLALLLWATISVYTLAGVTTQIPEAASEFFSAVGQKFWPSEWGEVRERGGGSIGNVWGALWHVLGMFFEVILMWLWFPLSKKIVLYARRKGMPLINSPVTALRGLGGSLVLNSYILTIGGLVGLVLLPMLPSVVGVFLSDVLADGRIGVYPPEPARYFFVIPVAAGLGLYCIQNREWWRSFLGTNE